MTKVQGIARQALTTEFHSASALEDAPLRMAHTEGSLSMVATIKSLTENRPGG
jgi:hypothetical protein